MRTLVFSTAVLCTIVVLTACSPEVAPYPADFDADETSDPTGPVADGDDLSPDAPEESVWAEDFESSYPLNIQDDWEAEARTVSDMHGNALELSLSDVFTAGSDGSWIYATLSIGDYGGIEQEASYRLTLDTQGDADCDVHFEGTRFAELTNDSGWTTYTHDHYTGFDGTQRWSVAFDCFNTDVVPTSRRFDNIRIERL